MSGFYCGICGKNSDETEAVFYEEYLICSSCWVVEQEEIRIEAGI